MRDKDTPGIDEDEGPWEIGTPIPHTRAVPQVRIEWDFTEGAWIPLGVGAIGASMIWIVVLTILGVTL